MRVLRLQWISEVMHFCAGLPIILVGCKKDLRRDQRVIEELRKTNQRPVTPEEVRFESAIPNHVTPSTYMPFRRGLAALLRLNRGFYETWCLPMSTLHLRIFHVLPCMYAPTESDI